MCFVPPRLGGALCLLAAWAAIARGGDWPQILGPSRSGQA